MLWAVAKLPMVFLRSTQCGATVLWSIKGRIMDFSFKITKTFYKATYNTFLSLEGQELEYHKNQKIF